MFSVYVLLVGVIQAVPQHPFNMYSTDNDHDGYCLSFYALNHFGVNFEAYGRAHQLIPYCLRTSEETDFIAKLNFSHAFDHPQLTFGDLKEQNITSEMLLSLSASVDLAERYQIFLNKSAPSLLEEKELFYNCTSFWFGPFCRFMFDYKTDKSFNDLVVIVFEKKSRLTKNIKGPSCYKHLNCQTRLPCLDWHEICDGKSDCSDGSDEENCWQLEVNECTKDEYRCHDGQCIPFEFRHDMLYIPDCLDRTDERLSQMRHLTCYKDPTFQCEEHLCFPGGDEFPCGDGECTNGIAKCYNGRDGLSSGDFCSNATACALQLSDQVYGKWCKQFCSKLNCFTANCPSLFEFRLISALLGHVKLIFSSNNIQWNTFSLPHYVCYDEKLCADFLPFPIHSNNLTCRPFHDLELGETETPYNTENLIKYVKDRFRVCSIIRNEIPYCNYSTMYQCDRSSKCISKQRLLDGMQDCPFNDDETFNQSCSLADVHQRFKCSFDGHDKCFATVVIQNGKDECKDGEDEGDQQLKSLKKHIYFQTICDGKTELSPMEIEGQNETDETECEHWICDNPYSICDQFWLCKDGADEINCPTSICPVNHHSCIFPNDTSNMSCLPIALAGNGVDDCLGGTDERKKREIDYSKMSIQYSFHCWNTSEYINTNELCNRNPNCPYEDDEQFCKTFGTSSYAFCTHFQLNYRGVDKFICDFGRNINLKRLVYFKLGTTLTYPPQITTIDKNSTTLVVQSRILSSVESPVPQLRSEDAWRCNRGIPIRIRTDTPNSDYYCLCPPNYYGRWCEYQNQRVSLTLQIRTQSDWRNLFIVLITLIDEEKNIESHEYIEYSPTRDCIAKFNVYLLYSTRPKNSSKHYAVQIDVYNQVSLIYRASWIYPLRFPFLPVHRLPVLLKVPPFEIKPTDHCRSSCIHGQCFSYVNSASSTFCRCQPGWSGVRCDQQYTCNCAPGSLCISNTICVCSRGHFGSRCHLFQPSCHSRSCMNDGQCIPMDIRYASSQSNKSICLCPSGYGGNRCQDLRPQTQLDVSFHPKLTIPSLLLVHFIHVSEITTHNRTSIMKKIRFDQEALTIFVTVSFHIAFAEMFNNYYLIAIREQAMTVVHISTEILPSQRCQSLGELFNETFAKRHLLKRIKYYQLPCQERPSLVCFYDDVHLCLCTRDRRANCFEFVHNMTYNCGAYDYCENKGHCFQDDLKCPTALFCACRQCYFGSKCQFSTKGSTLALDIILGYHIRPQTEIPRQSTVVKVSIGLVTNIFVFGCINSFLSFQTFRRKETRNVGCGLYLLVSSIVSMITVTLLLFKFWILLVLQMGSIDNHSSFSDVQCRFLDFCLRSLLSINDWLSACVAIERATSVSKGIHFDKTQSQRVAQWLIVIVTSLTTCTYIYDPLHRQVMEDKDEQHTWCVSQYSSFVQILDASVNIFHFATPFLINCISALIIIFTVARTRSNCQKTKSFAEHIFEQTRHHKHILISPVILIVLAVPRLIISFLSGCMESAQDSWLYLVGYFVSFVPSIMTFAIFILPSKKYKNEFKKAMQSLY